MRNNIFVQDYIIKSPYYKLNNKRFIIFSDVHFHKKISRILLDKFLNFIIFINPDFIIIPGDLIDEPKAIKEDNTKNFITNYLKKLSELSKIIIVPGNHDVGEFTLKNFKNTLDNKNNYNNEIINYLESLNNYNNIYFLNNEQVNIDDIDFFGFNPRLETYLKIDDNFTNEILIEDYLKCNFKFSDNNYNVFLTHFNALTLKEEIYNNLTDFFKTDLIISGHYHNGYMPKNLDFYFNNNNHGIYFTPNMNFFTNNITRDINEFGRGYQIVSRGFRKYTTDLKIFNYLDSISSHDVECINLSNSDDLDYKRTLKKKV